MTNAATTAMRRLHIAPLDPANPTPDLAFGPWVLVSDPQALARWREYDFPDPFPSADSWVEADRRCRRLANMLVPRWADRLNSRYGTTYSTDFWRVVTLTWLTWAVPPLWYRWRYAEEFIARHGGEELAVPVLADAEDWGISDTSRLIYTLFEPLGDARLSSLVLAELCPPAWHLVPLEDVDWPRPKPIAAAPNARPTRIGALVKRLFGRLPVQSVPGAPAAKLPLSLLAALLPRRAGAVHYAFDDDAVFALFPARFLDLLDRYLDRVLPHTFRDGLEPLVAAAEGQRYHPGRLLMDQLSSSCDARRIGLAMAHDRGERLVSCQHGGTYGTAQAMMASMEMDYAYDAFLTWGWTEQEDYRGRFIPLPFPELCRVRDRHRERAARMVIVGNSMTVRGSRLGWLPTPQHYLAYREAKVDFLNGLAPAPRRGACYRPYRRGHSDLPDEDYIRAAAPDIALQEGDLTAALLSCRLAVIDHPVTTMLTALAADVPTVLYWQREAWPLARQAEPLFEGLRRAGILHHDAAAAAAQVNAVWDDVPGWWRSAAVQQARRAFVDRYARTAPLWWAHWARALWRLSRAEPTAAGKG